MFNERRVLNESNVCVYIIGSALETEIERAREGEREEEGSESFKENSKVVI